MLINIDPAFLELINVVTNVDLFYLQIYVFEIDHKLHVDNIMADKTLVGTYSTSDKLRNKCKGNKCKNYTPRQ